MKYKAKNIFTSQGLLEDVEKNPNLDVLMNIFNIPRAFGVSGFARNWNVGMHAMATSYLAFFWAKFNNYTPELRNELVAQAILHDVHEAVTGDILPHFKSKVVKEELNSIQHNMMKALGIEESKKLKVAIKIIDHVAFIYEIKQVSPSILNSKKVNLANLIAERQQQILFDYCKENGVKKEKIQAFLKQLDLT